MNSTHTHKLKNWVVTFAAAILLVGLTLSTAEAGDKKVYPGWMCKGMFGGMDNSQISRNWSGAISNVDYRNTYVICPILRDKVTGDDTFSMKEVRVYYEDKSTTDSVSCNLRNFDPRTGKRDTILSASSPQNDTAKHFLKLGPIYTYASQNKGEHSYNYSLMCVIPGKTADGNSLIYGYSALEAGGD